SAQDYQKLRDTHDAVYVAVGAGRPKRLPQLPASAPWLMDGAEYLARVNAGRTVPLGRRLVVVGGGSAALDAARSARRAGHEVTLLALERAEQMPAQREELAEALEEGITLVDGAMLDSVSAADQGLALRCVRVRFEPGAVRGRFTVTPLPESGFTLAADAIVPSIGQDPELAAFTPWLPVNGALLAVDHRQASGAERLWAGGDVASMARFVTEAVGMGKRAALDIDRALRGLAGEPDAAPLPAVGLERIATFYHPHLPRPSELRRAPAERVAGHAEVQIGLELEQALAESERCFSCGTCTHCDNCFHHCPDLAIERVDGGYSVLADYCKGCGVCVKECPTGSMTMLEETR
ncbi:MAG TPA: FAD-dependent oxidoreductase, partial [Albitalea sp.]|nr:FAD-dependent oxidoreductase [Albitalea sp.]